MELRRRQVPDEAAGGVDAGLPKALEVLDLLVDNRKVAGLCGVAGAPRTEDHRREALGQHVVDLASETLALTPRAGS